MLIVCTKDPIIVQTAQDPRSGSGMWGTLVILDPRFNQAQATAAMTDALRGSPNEPLCFSAHGNDDEIGDEGSGSNDWSWSRAKLALILQDALLRGFCGPILIHACAQRVSNFSAGLAVALERIRALNGVWIYGYQKPVPVRAGFPHPYKMDRNVELYGSQVKYLLDAEAPPAAAQAPTAEAPTAEAPTAPAPPAGPCFEFYRASFPSGHAVTVPQGFDPDELRRLLGLLAESPLR
jgi:hypothetical protein